MEGQKESNEVNEEERSDNREDREMALEEFSMAINEAKELVDFPSRPDIVQTEEDIETAKKQLWAHVFADIAKLKEMIDGVYADGAWFYNNLTYDNMVLDTRVLDTNTSIEYPQGRRICILIRADEPDEIPFYTGAFDNGKPALLHTVEACGEIRREQPGLVYRLTKKGSGIKYVSARCIEQDIINILVSWDAVYPNLLRSATGHIQRHIDDLKERNDGYVEALKKQCDTYGLN